MKVFRKTITIIIYCTFFLLLCVQPIDIYAAKKKKTSKSQTSRTVNKSKKNSRSRPNTTKRNIVPNSHIFLIDSLLSEGISYKQLVVTINNLKHCVDILQVDLTNKKTEINVIKGGNNITELERLPIMLSNANIDTTQKKIMGGINANFWRAYTNYPMGPAVINGEVAEMLAYKKWTSTFLNEEGLPFMGYFSIQGEVVTPTSNRLGISSVNHRTNQNGLVIYNKYGGNVIPYINSDKVTELLLAGMDNIFQGPASDDSTESVEALNLQKEELLEAQRSSNLEYDLKKIIVHYIDPPAINTFIKCEVVGYAVGSVKMPANGYVISVGADCDTTQLPKIGDKINLHYWTNIHESEVFLNAVCGTPRLVRDGIARHEAYEEGSQKKRFISGALPRTAIGYNKNKTKLFLVATSNRKGEGTIGTSLSQLAEIMEYIGCYSAQNLDGGGSTNMVVCGENVINPTTSRRLSVAISAVSLKNEKQNAKLPKKKKSK